jgi:hypothetical protein
VTEVDEKTLAAEFRLFARHLTRAGGTPYQQAKYVEAHQKLGLHSGSRFDRWMLAVARSGPGGVLLADAYTGLLARKSLLRSKLVLTLALLECAPPSFAELDRPDRGGVWLALLATALGGFEFAFAFLLGVLIFAPAQLWFAATGPER